MLLAYGHVLEGFGESQRMVNGVLSCAKGLWLCTTLLWQIAYSHMLTQHLVLLVKKKWLISPSNDKEVIKKSWEYIGFTYKITHR
jgi:hypothetical protein